MKKFFTHEVKIAVTGIIAAVILFFGLNFLKGLNIFSSNYTYYAQFTDISGLANGSPIFTNGYKVGTVKSINYNFNRNGDIVAMLSIDKQLQIPQGSYVELASELLGGTKLNLIIANNSTQIYAEGDTLSGGMSNGVLNQVSNMVPTVENMLPKLDSILANVNNLLSDPSLKGTIHNTEHLTAQLTSSADQLNNFMSEINKALPSMMNKTNGVLDGANKTMTNVSSLTQKLDESGLDKMIAELNSAILEAKSIVAKINNGTGTAGALVNDKQLYDNLNTSVQSLNKTLQQAEILVKDLKENPKRYVHFSIFGKKN